MERLVVPKRLRAEVISIGDEMTSGQRLDTNSKWLSEQLEDLGVEVAFHTTVGDNLKDNVDVFRTAAIRTDLVVATGGLGPTQDDLTRQALASMAEVELVRHEEVVAHIRKIFKQFGREMPANNKVQADFPAGSTIIDNPEGTAPGIDMRCELQGTTCQIFSLPGVPAEMKQMWASHVAEQVKKMAGQSGTIVHHVIHCFGIGESQTEQMMPEMFRRGREPRVGITASRATISIRISSRGDNEKSCLQNMETTIAEVESTLGDLVFGSNGQTLQDVVVTQLDRCEKSVSIVDFALEGDVAKSLVSTSSNGRNCLGGSLMFHPSESPAWIGKEGAGLADGAGKVRAQFNSDFGICIGPIEKPGSATAVFSIAIVGGDEICVEQFGYRGHSDFRHERSVKQVLNRFRLLLEGK